MFSRSTFATKLFDFNLKEVTTVDNLSNEILLEIFSFLDANSCLDACLVCKRWNEMIGFSVTTMKKFKLKLDLERIEERNDGTEYHRKHVNVDVFYNNVFDKIANFVGLFDLSQVRNLRIYGPQTVEIHEMIKFLSKMPSMKNLHFHPFFISNTSGYNEAETLALPHLTDLLIDSVTCTALKFFNIRQLSKISVNGYRVPNEDDANALENFLKGSENLKSLEINEHMFTRIFGKELPPKFNFSLTSFEMSYHCTMDGKSGKNFNSFLASQASTLRYLSIYSVKNIPSTTFSIIFNNLQSLEKLCINVSSVPSSRNFFVKSKPNTAVKMLRLYESFSTEAAAAAFFGNMPNVENIVLNQNIGNYIDFIAAFNPFLMELKLSSISSQISTDSIFNKLRILTINFIKDSNAWISLVASCPSLETFVVNSFEKNTVMEAEVDFLLQQKLLRNLTFDGNYGDIKIIFDVLKLNYGNLKTLKLLMSNTSEYGTTVNAMVKFDFPQIASLWSVEAAESKFEMAWEERSW